ncbi:AAA family ATPase [Nesterenkonia populi]|uniref:AAA family ATPase n=1 Tax=Nesterenkonia populi TaxID=1591087 RepID=UPI0011BF9D45|nr:SMC family ATPase [Nesterenkonia populi]
MKLHRMALCAFGPFPGTETVDFDQLSAEGLFLLRGRTGSGKTSVLDAVTFALYGRVAGQRDHNLLKSHHAPADRTPYVELEFSRGEDRYWIRRTPAYTRPGRATQVSPTIALKRWSGAEWEQGVSGVQAANAELQSILGLDVHQFTKVILLPQGDFADFLHAKSAEKQTLLEQLFDTFRFRRLEEQLNEQAKEARARSERIEAQIEQLTSRLRSDAAALLVPPPEDEAEQTRPEQVELDDVPAESLGERVTVQAEARRSQMAAQREAARDAAEKARSHAEELSARQKELHRWTQHQAASQAHQDSADQAEQDRARCARHEQALTVEKWFREAAKARAAQQQAFQQAQESAQSADDTLRSQWQTTVGAETDTPTLLSEDGAPAPDKLQQAAEALAGLRARLAEEEAEQLEGRHAELLRTAEEASQSAEQAQQKAQELTSAVEQLEQAREQLTSQRQEEETLDAAADAARGALTSAQAAAKLIERRDRAAEQQARLHQVTEKAQQEYQEQDAAYQRAVSSYRGGMAAQLAERLQPGEPCIVCGSVDHPAPHTPQDAGGTTAEQVEGNRQRMADAHQAAVEASAQHRTSQQQHAELLEELGGESETSAAEIAERAEAAQAQLDSAQEARREQQRIARELEKTADQLHAAQNQLTAAHHERRSSADEAERQTAAAAELDAVLVRLRGDHPSVAARLEAVRGLEAAVERVSKAVSAEQASAAAARTAEQAADRELAESPFVETDELRSAQLQHEELADLQASAKAHEAQAQRLAYEAEQPEVQAGQARQAAGETPPAPEELNAAQQAARRAETTLEQVRDALTTFDARREAVTGCIASLDEALRTKADQAQEQTRLLALAETLSGRGHDNPMRMTLTTFVLAAKLEEVAQAASHHLTAMSEGRYRLLHQDTGPGGSKQGLDLKVHDEHSDEHRPTSSLSGGETFMASLAMALGLAEVVQSEAGGVEMESLFIDEGFGSLDEHTLEAVMGALTSLQGQGRRVGVVSHVTEMHSQIPSQLLVTKTRTGSALTTSVPG